jgi:hypothetical protein
VKCPCFLPTLEAAYLTCLIVWSGVHPLYSQETGRPRSDVDKESRTVATGNRESMRPLRITVVRFGTSERLPGALVLAFNAEDLRVALLGVSPLSIPRLDALYDAIALKFTANEDGVAAIPAALKTPLVIARSSGLVGSRYITSDETAIIVTAYPERRVRARVIDAMGNGVAGVRLLLRDATTMECLGGVDSTGPEGEAVIVPPATLQSKLAERGTHAALQVVVACPGISAVVPADITRANVSNLTIPATGSLIVTLLDASGRRLNGRFMVGAVPIASESDQAAPSLSDMQETEANPMVLRHVALGRVYRINGSSAQMGEQSSVIVQGPTRPGQEVTVSLPIRYTAPWITGTVVDEGGAVVRPCVCEAAIAYDSSTDHGYQRDPIETDRNGRVRVRVNQTASMLRRSSNYSMWLLLWEQSGEAAGVGQPKKARGARIALPMPLQIGETDLGRITLSVPPIIAAGHIVDRAGRPVPQASVSVFVKPSQWKPGEILGGLDVAVPPARSDDSGQFVLRGFQDRMEVVIVAEARGKKQGAPIACRAGERDVTITMDDE